MNNNLARAPIKISVKELEKACALILEYVRRADGEEITFETDWYWTVNPEQKYRIDEERPSLLIGSLSDNVEGINKVLYKPDEYLPTNVDLEWLGEIFIGISEQTSI
jgi:hypothetical protein